MSAVAGCCQAATTAPEEKLKVRRSRERVCSARHDRRKPWPPLASSPIPPPFPQSFLFPPRSPALLSSPSAPPSLLTPRRLPTPQRPTQPSSSPSATSQASRASSSKFAESSAYTPARSGEVRPLLCHGARLFITCTRSTRQQLPRRTHRSSSCTSLHISALHSRSILRPTLPSLPPHSARPMKKSASPPPRSRSSAKSAPHNSPSAAFASGPSSCVFLLRLFFSSDRPFAMTKFVAV